MSSVRTEIAGNGIPGHGNHVCGGPGAGEAEAPECGPRVAGLAGGAMVRVLDAERSQDRRPGRGEGWFCGPVSTQPRVHGVRPQACGWLCASSTPCVPV